jgi:(1->4)-alpha-D-glucan 1-alpha-D-glucosylmutase
MDTKIPLALYRFQFNHHFTFHDAEVLVDYLKNLGITDIYASPIMKARKESLHGYDITDYGQLNPELGTEKDFEKLAEKIKTQGMGFILDIVPNHMCIHDPSNKWWWDVLENGRNSPYAAYFDIDWEPPKPELINKVLLPFLDEQFGMVIESHQVCIEQHNGSFILKCPHCILPVNPKTWNMILKPIVQNLYEVLSPNDSHYIELKSIVFEIEHLPGMNEMDPNLIEERQIEKEVVKKRLNKLLEDSEIIKAELNKELERINGNSDDFSLLEALLKNQAFRLSYWRVANEEINYRRFFDINDLAGLRTENLEVFAQVHGIILRLISNGWVTGLRIDHVDGLLDPEQYFTDLQRACFEAKEGDTSSKVEKNFYVIIEKILTGEEKLPSQWLVHGTTGYDFLNLLNGIFVEIHNREPIYDFYRRFTEQAEKISDIIYQSKKFILYVAMPAELHVLARHLDRISEQHRWSRDFTRETLLSSLRNVISSFPVYRSYIRADKELLHETDKNYIHTAIRKAKKMNPATSGSVFDFIQSVLLLEHPPGLSPEQIASRKEFVMRFQQHTGPVMAKGLEDTAFYRVYPLASINEVGGELQRFGISTEKFHNENIFRKDHWPYSFLTTSTHDTKRSEDVRARINVLSEIPEQWRDAVLRWNLLNKKTKRTIDDEAVPGNQEEYLIYQTLVGTWPLELTSKSFDSKVLESFRERIVLYICKAMHEAKIHTSWINPNEDYDQAVESFLRNILDRSASSEFLKDFMDFIPQIIRCGMFNSLSQVLLKTTCPGVPEFYQGCELWNFTLVDPDNRSPVDFHLRQNLLNEIIEQSDNPITLIEKALDSPNDGKIKLYITRESLLIRQKYPSLFSEGTYTSLETHGDKSHHLIAFARNYNQQCTITIAGRFFSKFCLGEKKPVGNKCWGTTLITLPNGTYRDAFTGIEFQANDNSLKIAELLSHLPIALLEKI